MGIDIPYTTHMYWCKAYHWPSALCICGADVDNTEEPMGKNKHKNKKHKKNKQHKDKKVTQLGFHTSYQSCASRHWRQSVKVGGYKVLTSAYMDRPQGAGTLLKGKRPDCAYYLHDAWVGGMGGFASSGMATPRKSAWPFVFCDWRDYASWYQEDYKVLLKSITRQIKRGQRVEIACNGGHGRTGTVIAGLIALLENKTAKQAIEATRKRLCSHAVETGSQVNMVYSLRGESPPLGSPALATTYSGGMPGEYGPKEPGKYYTKRRWHDSCGICNHGKQMHDGSGHVELPCGSSIDGGSCICPAYCEAAHDATYCAGCGHIDWVHTNGICALDVCPCTGTWNDPVIYNDYPSWENNDLPVTSWVSGWMNDTCEVCPHARRDHYVTGEEGKNCRVIDCKCKQYKFGKVVVGSK